MFSILPIVIFKIVRIKYKLKKLRTEINIELTQHG